MLVGGVRLSVARARPEIGAAKHAMREPGSLSLKARPDSCGASLASVGLRCQFELGHQEHAALLVRLPSTAGGHASLHRDVRSAIAVSGDPALCSKDLREVLPNAVRRADFATGLRP